MLNRSVLSKSAVSLFHEEFNDIDIYIEDTATGYRKIFKEIINRALSSQYSIEQVFPIGTRSEVINECKKHQLSTGRRKIFIVDGDFHILNGREETVNGLYVLPRYCIENYFLSEDAIAHVAYEEDSELEIDSIISNLNFSSWIDNNEELLVELFVMYAICHSHLPQEQTTKFKVTKLCSSNSGVVCKDKTRSRIEELKEKLQNHLGEEQLKSEINRITSEINKKDKKLLRYISGKDYLLPLMISRLQSFMHFPVITINIKIRLAMKTDVEELKDMVDYIIY